MDFYSGLIYQAIGFPVGDVPGAVRDPAHRGWLAQWLEMLADPEQKIARPRQIYLGSGMRSFVEIGKRERCRERDDERTRFDGRPAACTGR